MLDLKYTFDALRDRGEKSFFITLTNDDDSKRTNLVVFSGDDPISKPFLDVKMSQEEGEGAIRRFLEPTFGRLPPFKDITINCDNYGEGRTQLFIGDNNFTFQIVDNMEQTRTEFSFRKKLNGKGYFQLPEFEEVSNDHHLHYVLKEGDGNIKHEYRHIELF